MKVPKIYLDCCSLNRPFDNQTQIKIRLETEAKLYIQSCIREERFSLVWSFMLDYENSKNPYDEKRGLIAPWKEIAKAFCPPSKAVLSRAKGIMSLGIKHEDALHISCAVEMNCAYFITTDAKLTNKIVANIKIVNPIGFVAEMEELI